MSDIDNTAAPKPAPSAPRAGELLELSLTALINAPGVFAGLEARPAPGPGASFLAALCWGALFLGLNLLHAAIANPAAVQAYAPWQVGAAAFCGLGAWTALYLLGSSFVYGLGRMLGSGGDFDRALLVAAVTLTAAPAQALCSWFPMAWVVPTVVAAWMLACGLGSQFKANAWAARGACAVLSAGVLAVQYGAGLVVDKYSAAAKLATVAAQAAPSAGQLAELQAQMQQLQQAQAESPATVRPESGQSSLDLLRGPAGEEAPKAQPTQLQQISQMNAAGDAMNKNALGMLDAMTPMLSNPMITRNMTAPQKADFGELQKMIAELKSGIATNSITSAQEQQAKMMKIQQLLMRMMSAGMAMPKPQTAPGAEAKK